MRLPGRYRARAVRRPLPWQPNSPVASHSGAVSMTPAAAAGGNAAAWGLAAMLEMRRNGDQRVYV